MVTFVDGHIKKVMLTLTVLVSMNSNFLMDIQIRSIYIDTDTLIIDTVKRNRVRLTKSRTTAHIFRYSMWPTLLLSCFLFYLYWLYFIYGFLQRACKQCVHFSLLLMSRIQSLTCSQSISLSLRSPSQSHLGSPESFALLIHLRRYLNAFIALTWVIKVPSCQIFRMPPKLNHARSQKLDIVRSEHP